MAVRKWGVARSESPPNRAINVKKGNNRWIMRGPPWRRGAGSLLVVWPELGRDPSLAHDEDAIGDLQELLQLRADHEDGVSGSRQLVHEMKNLRLGRNVDAAGGFVKENDTRAGQHPLGDDHLLLIAAAELARRWRLFRPSTSTAPPAVGSHCPLAGVV